MQIEENKTVDLPDENSGPATEIDITDPSTESENNNNIEVSNETTTEDNIESKDSSEKSSEQSDFKTS